jgi:hypothetical protein
MIKEEFVNVEMPVLDYSLICFSGSRIHPWILTEAFINKIVDNKELSDIELGQLSLSKFYQKLAEWLKI